MGKLSEKVNDWQDKNNAKGFEDWKKTRGRSVVKNSLAISFFLVVIFTLIRVLYKCFYIGSYNFNEFKIDFGYIVAGSLFFGIFFLRIANLECKKKLEEEKAGSQKYGSILFK